MSPASQESDWVEREVLEAQRHDRQILPILLGGERRLFLLAASHFVDARDGSLPGARELDQLRRLAAAGGVGPHAGLARADAPTE